MDHYLISVGEAVTVAVTAAVLYVVFVLLIRLLSQRVLTAMSSLDVIVVITMGAVIGRAILGVSTDLAGGVVALVTLFVIQAMFALARRWGRVGWLLRNLPLALIADGEVLGENLRRARLEPEDLWSRLRIAGVSGPQEVAAMVLESSGQISVVRRSMTMDPRMLEGVAGLRSGSRDS